MLSLQSGPYLRMVGPMLGEWALCFRGVDPIFLRCRSCIMYGRVDYDSLESLQ